MCRGWSLRSRTSAGMVASVPDVLPIAFLLCTVDSFASWVECFAQRKAELSAGRAVKLIAEPSLHGMCSVPLSMES